MSTLFVINPNASQSVTDGIDAAIDPLRSMGTDIACLTLPDGPPGIESQAQADEVVPHLLALAHSLEGQAAGFVIACFGDPGLHALRDRTTKPTLGIQECSVLAALALGQRFGVISILPASIPRHMRAFGAMGVMDRLAGDRALDLGVADLADAATTQSRMEHVGAELRDRDGADVLIMGCAGMARYRDPLETALGVPVVEPCQAATAMALGLVRLGRSHNPGGPNAR
jgi:Asp/Glu/hydantoin racemase